MTPTETVLTSAPNPTSYIDVDGTRFAYRELGDPASVMGILRHLATVRCELPRPLAIANAFAPALANNGGGALLNVLSVLSWVGIGDDYSATKSACGRRPTRSGSHQRPVAPS